MTEQRARKGGKPTGVLKEAAPRGRKIRGKTPQSIEEMCFPTFQLIAKNKQSYSPHKRVFAVFWILS